MRRNDIQTFTKKCVNMYYMKNINDFNFHYEVLVLAMSWDFFFKNILKTCPILDIILSYFLIFVNNVKFFVPYSNYNIIEARSLAIIIVCNKTK